jgi:hypothetical protein
MHVWAFVCFTLLWVDRHNHCPPPARRIVGLRSGGIYPLYFILNLFLSLVVVESLMMVSCMCCCWLHGNKNKKRFNLTACCAPALLLQAIAPLVPHYLMGIAAGAGIMGLYMIVCGFFQPLNSMPKVRRPACTAGAVCLANG